MKKYRVLAVSALIGLTLTAFQNCGSDFNPEEYAQQSSLSGGQPSNPADTVPVIMSQSPNTTVSVGQGVTLSVSTQGANLVYTWFKNNVQISGAKSASYSIASAAASDAATYRVNVANSAGTVSASIVLTVNAAPVVTTPVVTAQPVSTSMTMVIEGAFPDLIIYWNPGSVTLAVSASGSGLSYQWYFDGTDISGQAVSPEAPIAGATSSSLVVAATEAGVTRPIDKFCGKYRVRISNSAGVIFSNVATVSCMIGTTIYQ